MTRDFVVTAVDILAATLFGEPVEPHRINRIRRHSPSRCDWPITDLCRHIIETELASVSEAAAWSRDPSPID